MTSTRQGWAIEIGPIHAPLYFCNGYIALADGQQAQAWTSNFQQAHLWRTSEGALAATEEWAMVGPQYRIVNRFQETH